MNVTWNSKTKMQKKIQVNKQTIKSKKVNKNSYLPIGIIQITTLIIKENIFKLYKYL